MVVSFVCSLPVFSSSFSSSFLFAHRSAGAPHAAPAIDPWGPLKVSAGALSARFLDKSQLDGNHLKMERSLNNEIGLHARIGCGATGFAFVDEQFVSQHNLPRHQLHVPRTLEPSR